MEPSPNRPGEYGKEKFMTEVMLVVMLVSIGPVTIALYLRVRRIKTELLPPVRQKTKRNELSESGENCILHVAHNGKD